MKHDIGPYELLTPIGFGGMGEVFLARLHREKGFTRHVALKRILPDLSKDPVFREMFAAEARLSATLQHPDIVQVLDFGHDGDTYYLVMEYVQGADLHTLLSSAKNNHQKMPLDFCMSIVFACVRALIYAHSQSDPVVHGDICPENVLVGMHGEIKLADFGLVRLKNSGRKIIAGHLAYLAPEAAMGHMPTSLTDQFSLGAMMLKMLTGNGPYPEHTDQNRAIELAKRGQVTSLDNLANGIPTGVFNVIKKMLEVDPERRFESMSELKQALEILIKGLSLSVGDTTVERVFKKLAPQLINPKPQQKTDATIISTEGSFSKSPYITKTKTWKVLLLPAIVGTASVFAYLLMVPSTPDTSPMKQVILSPPPLTKKEIDKTKSNEPGMSTEEKTTAAHALLPQSSSTRIPKNRPTPIKQIKSSKTAASPLTKIDSKRKVRFVENPKKLLVATKPGTSWSLGNADWTGATVKNVSLGMGTHVIHLKDENLSATIRIENSSIENPDSKKTCHVSLRTTPFAIIKLDGKPRGTSPLGGLVLDTGKHLLQMISSDSILELNITVP